MRLLVPASVGSVEEYTSCDDKAEGSHPARCCPYSLPINLSFCTLGAPVMGSGTDYCCCLEASGWYQSGLPLVAVNPSIRKAAVVFKKELK